MVNKLLRTATNILIAAGLTALLILAGVGAVTAASALSLGMPGATATAASGGPDSGPADQLVDESDLSVPAALADLGISGLEVQKRFATGIEGVEGLVMRINGEPNMVYSIEGGRYVMIGMLLGDGQRNLTQQHAEAHMPNWQQALAGGGSDRRLPSRESGGIDPDEAFAAVQSLPFVVEEGRGETVLYVTMDPYCPHCASYYRASRELLDEVTFRWIPLGFLSDDSLRQAALLADSDDPVATLAQMQAGGLSGEPSDESREIIQRNSMLMRDAGLTMTPVTVYMTADGTPKVVRGALSAQQIRALLPGGDDGAPL